MRRLHSTAALGLVLLLSLVLPAVGQDRVKTRPSDPLPQPDGNPQYFPEGVFRLDPNLRVDGIARLFASRLRDMDEPSLFAHSGSKEHVYRVVKLSSFWNNVAVRLVVAPDGTGQLFTKIRDYHEGHAVTARTQQVDNTDVQKFLTLLESSRFWEMPSAGPLLDPDATLWAIEGVRDIKYHAVERQELDPTSYTDACKYLVEDLAKATSKTKRHE